jgi:hypothetical protein
MSLDYDAIAACCGLVAAMIAIIGLVVDRER